MFGKKKSESKAENLGQKTQDRRQKTLKSAQAGPRTVEVRPCRLSPETETIGKEKIMKVDCSDCYSNASIGNPVCMEGVLKTLSEKQDNFTQLVLKKNSRKSFPEGDVNMLKEAAGKIKAIDAPDLCKECAAIFASIWADPAYVYYKLKDRNCRKCPEKTKEILDTLSGTRLIKSVVGSKHADYTEVFQPHLIPSMVSSYIDPVQPKGKPETEYNVSDTLVSIYSLEGRADMHYFIRFPEFSLSKGELDTIEKVFQTLLSKKAAIDFSPEKVRDEFRRHIKAALGAVKGQGAEKLENIILRHTIGYGSIEPLLLDEKIQDVYVDSGSPLVHIVHSDFGECITNIYASHEEIEKLSTRLRALSKRPFDASSPVIHTELQDLGVRVCGICEPSTYKGTGFAFRKRKPVPWTLAEFVSKKMADFRIAGLLSYLVDSQNSILITGPRSSGKTSLMTSLILEMPRNSRIILIEDTPEMPVHELRALGFKIEHLKTEAFAKGFEISTEDALRTSLRLGDSILIIGEVRGSEAKALFEAMRVGAAGNVVLGTIHGSNAYDTFDRVVNDLGVPATSFKAVDFVVTVGMVKRGDSQRKYRRILDISEIPKNWTGEPKFKSLVAYNSRSDSWKINLRKSEKLKQIASVKSVSIGSVLKSISTRSEIKKDLLKFSRKSQDFIAPRITVESNSLFTKLAGEGNDYKKIHKAVGLWLKNQ